MLGIDVGCSAVRASGAICRLDWDATTVTWTIARFRAVEPERTETIARIAGDGPIHAAAIDGPLAPGFGIIGRYRSCERMLTRRVGPLIGKPGQSSTPVGRLLNLHANACAGAVLDRTELTAATHGEAIDVHAVAESFPGAFLGCLLPAGARTGATRANRSDLFFGRMVELGGFARLLASLLPGRGPALPITALTDHDERAAFTCALAALGLALRLYTAVGDAADGWIILPPWGLIADDVRAALDANAAEERTGELHRHG